MNNIRTSILSGITFGILMGISYAIFYEISIATLLMGVISGILFGFSTYLFATSKRVKQQTQVETPEGDALIYSGGANHFVKAEAVGGRLYLFTDKIQFQSHNYNIQSHGLIIETAQIEKVGFYNTLGLFPNGLSITTTEGKAERFVVSKRKVWKAEIEKLITNDKTAV